MDKKSTSKFISTLLKEKEHGTLPEKLVSILHTFYESYVNNLPNHFSEQTEGLFLTFLGLVKDQWKNPYPFAHYHNKIREPFDYFRFGIDFLRPLVDMKSSSIKGKEHLKQIKDHLEQKHNVIFLANHQIEADPQAISLLLEKDFQSLAEQLIFVAGERVVTDPLAVPFSKGCDLLCIYSKRYIDHPPEKKMQKQLHNKKTMELMSDLLKIGGKCIYVAPSGGRDRRNKKGEVEISSFDPKSIEMMYLMAKKSKVPTFFYPMALKTYDLLPPPETIQVELGETRSTNRVGIHMAIGEAIDMENFPGSDEIDKEVRRKSRSDYIWNLVNQDYRHL